MWIDAIEAFKAKHGFAPTSPDDTTEQSEPLSGSPFVFYEACWETQSDAGFNATLVDPAQLTSENQNLVEMLTTRFQPLLRPNAEYLVEFTTRDLCDGTEHLQHYSIGFRTKGQVGHFHEFFDGSALLQHPQATSADFALDRLQPYIDIERSYPAPDGNLIGAKPLYYSNPDLRLFFTQNYVERFFTDWAKISDNLPTITASLAVTIIDPSVTPTPPTPPSGAGAQPTMLQLFDGPITTMVTFIDDPDPVLPPGLAQLANMTNLGPDCSGDLGIEEVPASHSSVTAEDLRPQALYTAVWSSVLDGRAVEVHSYPFQTSRYPTHKCHIRSFVAHGPGDAERVGQPKVFLVKPVAAGASEIADVVAGSPPPAIQTMYATKYDQLFDGVFQLGGLPATVGVEFLGVGDDTEVYALIIRSEEPFNDPRLPSHILHQAITAPNLETIVAPDAGRIILVRADGMPLFGGTLTITFEHWQYASSSLAVTATQQVTVTLPGKPPPSPFAGITFGQLMLMQGSIGTSTNGSGGSTTTTPGNAPTEICPEHCDDIAELTTSPADPPSTTAPERPVNGLVEIPYTTLVLGKAIGPPHWVATDNPVLVGASDADVIANGGPSSKPEWVRALLPTHLEPSSGNIASNIYFVNGVADGWPAAHTQLLHVQSIMGPSYRVRIIFNESAATLADDATAVDYDYAWVDGEPFRSLCTQSIFSLLCHGFDRQADIGLIGASGGSLKTGIALRAFAGLGAAQEAYLENHIQLVHTGCLVHRQWYPWFENHLKRYRRHVDRRDPFARTFSGEVLPSESLDPVSHEGAVLSASDMSSTKPAISSVALAANAGLLATADRYHSISSNYMADPARHCEPNSMFDNVSTSPEPIVDRVRVRLRNGGIPTSNPIEVQVAGATFLANMPQAGMFSSGAAEWFDHPVSPTPLSSLNGITLTHVGPGLWRLREMTVEALTDQGARVVHQHNSLHQLFGSNESITFPF